jgi:hypothetical protein
MEVQMLEFLREEEGHSETSAVLVVLVAVVLLVLVLAYGGLFSGARPQPGVDVNVRPGS